MNAVVRTTALHDYVKQNPGFLRMYESYQPNLALIEKIKTAIAGTRLVVASEYWCGDSRRTVPHMARIVENLPGWPVEVYAWDNTRRGKPWQVRAIPTFIVYRGEQEVGRIVESPKHGSLEEDLVALLGAK